MKVVSGVVVLQESNLLLDLWLREALLIKLLMCSLPVVGKGKSWLLAPKDLMVQLARGPRPSEMRASV